MRIIKTSKEASNFEEMKRIANLGCDKCPCCGEISRYKNDKGILTGLHDTWVKGIFKPKYMRIDYYICYSCGAEWSSEPYQMRWL